ncbi:MAG: ferritin-like domain-containing protein [Ferruginibacter sp.]
MNAHKSSPPLPEKQISAYGLQRRNMLKFFGASAALITVASACKDDNPPLPLPNDGVNLGSGDVGILNYAYALEQLEAAFYIRVASSFYAGITPMEQTFLSDIRDHEVAHREFFKAAITGAAPTMIIPGLEVDFSSINFGSRASVLGAAKTFEDLGVAAYNGAGKLLVSPVYLGLAGKIVSVEARHAAAIRELLAINTFADTTDANGLDPAMTPPQVLAAAGTYIKTKINASNLPTS